MDYTVHGVAKSHTLLSNFLFHISCECGAFISQGRDPLCLKEPRAKDLLDSWLFRLHNPGQALLIHSDFSFLIFDMILTATTSKGS